MPDRDPLQPPASAEELRDVLIAQIRRQSPHRPLRYFTACRQRNSHGRHAAARPGSLCRFQPAHIPAASGGISSSAQAATCAAMQPAVQAEGGLEVYDGSGRARARSESERRNSPTVCSGESCGRLSNHFGTSSSALAPTDVPLPSTSISTRTNACGVALMTTAPNWNGRTKRTGRSKKCDLPHGKTWRHHDWPQSSALWLKKCLRMRCTSSVKAGSAMTSSERGRGSGTS